VALFGLPMTLNPAVRAMEPAAQVAD